MEGNVLITLLKPGVQSGQVDGLAVGEVTEVSVWAIREDRGGGEATEEGIQVGEWETMFRVRRDGLEELSESWSLVDDRERVFEIERVAEAKFGFKRWWDVYAVRRN